MELRSDGPWVGSYLDVIVELPIGDAWRDSPVLRKIPSRYVWGLPKRMMVTDVSTWTGTLVDIGPGTFVVAVFVGALDPEDTFYWKFERVRTAEPEEVERFREYRHANRGWWDKLRDKLGLGPSVPRQPYFGSGI